MNHPSYLRKNRTSQNLDKQLLKKLYNQQNVTQHELMRFPLSIDQKDRIIKDSVSFISSNNQNYSQEQISRAYKFLCSNSENGVIDVKSLSSFLEQQSENFYTGVEMISLLDKNKKGYVSIDQFFNFFQKGIYGNEANLPQQMKKKQQLVKNIDTHYDGLLKNFQDPQFCEYAAKQIKRFKYSQQL